MTKSELRKLIEDSDAPDDTQVVVSSPDHEYRRAGACFITALDHGDDGSYTQDAEPGEPLGNYERDTYGPRVIVLLVY